MKIAVIADGDPLNIHTWSGTPFHMVRALQVEFPDLIAIRKPYPKGYYFLSEKVSRTTHGKVQLGWLPGVSTVAAISTSSELSRAKPDLVLCIANTTIGSAVSSRFPTVHISDATFALMRDYYNSFASMARWVKRGGEILERRVISQSQACLFSSKWAADSAIRDYKASPEKVFSIPWGSNSEDAAQPTPFDMSASKCCELVFIGLDWERKGGDIAVAAVRKLSRMGIPAKLHVLGAAPPDVQADAAVVFHGFISKATAEGRNRIEKILSKAAFLIVPTRQDCTPMVFAEANAYGVPAISTLTGGVSSLIVDGRNGYCLPPDAQPQDYADLVAALWGDPVRYLALRRSSREQFENVLNWRTWAKSVRTVLGHLGNTS